MSQGTSSGSFFSGSQAFITGGSFSIHNITNNHNVHVKGVYDLLLDAVAPNALHDSGHVVDPPKCHPGTRVAIIQTIIDWIGGSNEANRDKLFTWLTGAAGAGKSAIGRSVCERCSEEGTLLASFFFGSRDSTRNHSKSFAATIAYQICKLSPGLRTAVTAAIDHDPLIFTQSLRTQLISLVMRPLSENYANDPSRAPRLIVVDGLDECLDEANQQDILDSLFHLATTSAVPIRIILCSRPESHIVSMFSAASMSNSLFKIILDHQYTPRHDIELYLRDQLQRIRETHVFKASIPPGWPTQVDLDQITYKSSGQFIYATIVIRYLKSPRHRPQQRLDAILGLRPPFKDLPFSELDALYLHLLYSTDDPSLTADILAFLAFHDDMCAAHIDKMLSLESGDTEVVLSRLAAIVDIRIDGDLCLATMLHKSFADFLFDSTRSKGLSRPRTETMAWHCLRIIELFSEPHKSCRLQSRERGFFYFFPISLKKANNSDIIFQSWSTSAQSEFLDAVARFPIHSYCEELSSHSHMTCTDNLFLRIFFELMLQFEAKRIIPSEILHCHARDFCNYALLELQDRYKDNWRMNFTFTTSYLEPSIRRRPKEFNSFSSVIQGLGVIYPNPVVIRTFQLLLNESDRGLMIAKAAIYCLRYLCDSSRTRKMAKNHLCIREMDRSHRTTRPWKWHRRTSSRTQEKTPVLVVYTSWPRAGQLNLTTYGKLYAKDNAFQYYLYSLHSLRWTQWRSDIRKHYKDQSSHEYFNLLDYLITILPRAAKFEPLVHFCRTRAFSPMSMMFPDLSRRARRAIWEYLDRVDCDSAE